MRKTNRQQNYRYKILTAIIASLCLFGWTSVMADELAVSQFSTEGLTGWQAKIFHGLTQYTLTQENEHIVVKATSQASASGLVKKINFNPHRYRYLHWSWKIDHTISAGDETTKAGDDYSARIYVVFSGRFFWQTKAINYIWANKLKKGASVANAYTSSAMMVAVQSGPQNTGRWLTEQRDILSDYKLLFGSEPGEANAIAIMTDTDDTGEKAVAWYGEITLTTE